LFLLVLIQASTCRSSSPSPGSRHLAQFWSLIHDLDNRAHPALAGVAALSSGCPRTTAVLRLVRSVDRSVVLSGVLLDVLPHLLDGSVQRTVSLLLSRDKVVSIVRRLVRFTS
jgi:hypothetical protein